MLKTFGTVDSFVEAGGSDLKLGRQVANLQFLRALLRCSSFDGFHIFCPSTSSVGLARRTLEREIADSKILERVTLTHQLLLGEYLTRVEYHVVHVSGFGHYLPRLAHLRARFGKSFPLTGITHSLHTANIGAAVSQLLAAPFTRGDAIVCTSVTAAEVMKRYLREMSARQGGTQRGECPLRLERIPLGVADEYFVVPDRERSRQDLDLPRSGVLILYLGRISAYAKADLVPLLYVFRRLLAASRNAPQPFLVLAGGVDPGNLDNIRQAAAELNIAPQVILRPNVSDIDKFKLYGAADLFVSPIDNYQETFGLSILEAMAAGLPVIASDFDGYRELVIDHVTGFRIPTVASPPPGRFIDLLGILEPYVAQFVLAQGVAVDTEVLYGRLLALAEAPELRRQMGAAGKELARAEYSWPKVIAKYEQLWSELRRDAAAVPGPPDAAPDPWVTDPLAIFSQYPTRLLEPDCMLRCSPLGQEVLAGMVPVPALYQDLLPLVDVTLSQILLRQLAQDSYSVADLARGVRDQLGFSEDRTRYHLMWLLKNGLLALGSGDRTPVE